MNWVTFIVFAYIGLVLEVSCRGAFAIHALGGVSPGFVAPIFVAIALAAPRLYIMWACAPARAIGGGHAADIP